MKQVSTGGMSFQDIRDRDKYYVDKSLLIKDMLDKGDGDVYLYTRPRRFGKTTNITMLDAYFNMQYEGNTWFDGLAISEFPEFDRYRNAFPVIYLDLKDANPRDYGLFIESLNSIIIRTFKRFDKELSSDVVMRSESLLLDRIYSKKASEDDLRESILTLCEILHRYHGRRSIVLIDEYDRALTDSFGTETQKMIIDFLSGFFSTTLKSNRNLQMAYVTGVMQVAKAGMFSGLNNISINNIASTTSDERFGFTEAEVRDILGYYGHQDSFDDVRAWYDGYRFGDAEVYNPYSVMLYVQNGFRAEGYWTGTSENVSLRWMIQRADESNIDKVITILSGGSIETELRYDITYEDMMSLWDTNLYSLMAMTGYLKAEPTDSKTYLISIPNREVKEDLERILTNNKPVMGSKLFVEFCSSLLDMRTEPMETVLNRLLTSGNYLNLNREYAYEILLMTILKGTLAESHDVRTERQEGNGRTDIVLTPLKGGSPPIIIELKTADAIDKLDTAVEDAIRQIHDRRYYNGMKGRVVLYGIAFCGVVSKVGAEILDL
ncbi:AAA family ATPase [Methanomassiliicoccaceae archaeon DOK]|nr:AAA family ATPase [Methanomassiliicoccaceae archaeon DOK]